MIKKSKTAFAAALLVGATGLVAVSPAFARKDDKQQAQQGPQLKLSDDFRKVAGPAQKALQGGDLAAAETAVAATEAAAKTDDERYVAAKFRLSLTASQQKALGGTDAAAMARSDAALAAPLDALINNPVTPQKELGQYAYLRGSIAFDQNKYADALTYFQKAQAAGYQDPNMPLQLAKAKVETGDVTGGVAELDQVMKQQEAAGQKPSEQLYRYAIAKLYRTPNRNLTLDWVQRWLKAYPSAKNWRDAILAFGFQGPTAKNLNRAEQIDLYRLMRQTGSLADQQDYINYADLAYQAGLPHEAKTVIDAGRSSGKVSTSASAANQVYQNAQHAIGEDSSLSTYEKRAAAAAKGDLAAQTADAYLGEGEYAKAVALYREALQKGGVDANQVNTHLGIALAMSGDKAGAETAFNAVTAAPDTDIASLWKTWLTVGGPSSTTAPASTQG